MTTTLEKKSKPRIAHAVSVGNSYMDVRAIRRLAKRNPEAFMRKIVDLSEKGTLRLDQIRDWRSLWHATADVKVKTTMPDKTGAMRAITTSAFPLLTGTLVIAQINEAYEGVPTIGQDLVTEMNDPKKVTYITPIFALDKNVDEVKEHDEFPEISATEEPVEIRHKKNGRRLSISIEAINENEVADIVQRVNALGEIASEHVEEQTLERICDKYGSNTSAAAAPYVYRPNGSGTALYSATANTPGTRAPSGTRVTSNALADYTDLEAGYTRLATMKNERGKRIAVRLSDLVVVVPQALYATCLRTTNSIMVPGSANEYNPFGPQGALRASGIISSPKLDDISTSAWYMGSPKRQFRRKWKLDFEYVTLAGTDTQAYLNTQTAFQARLAWDVEVGAVDYVYFIQCLSGTTYTP